MADLSEIRSRIASGDKRTAQRMLARLLKEQPAHVDAWLLMAQVVDDVHKKSDCYNKVLEIEPGNFLAKDRLGWLYSQPVLTPEFDNPVEDVSQNNSQVEEVLEPLGGLPELQSLIKKKRKSPVKPKRWVILSALGLAFGILAILAIALLPSPIENLSISNPEPLSTKASMVDFPTKPSQADDAVSSQVPDIRVIYAKDGQLWQWENGESTGISPTGSDVMDLEISPDGQRIAFIRDGNMWLMGSQGGNAKQIVYSSLLPRIEQSGSSSSRKVCRLVWSKDSSMIFFNSCSEGGDYYDLHGVSVEDAKVTLLLPDNEGGKAFPSPNGKWVASVSPEEIHLTNMESLESIDIFVYDKVLRTSADQWLAPVVWSNDSSLIYTAIPPVNGRNKPNSPVRIWKIDVNSNFHQLVGELYTQGGDVIFSPQHQGLLFFVNNLNQESAELHWYQLQGEKERLLSAAVIQPACLTQDGKEFAVFKPGDISTLLTGTVGDDTIIENQTGLSSAYTIEHAICLGNGYVLVDGQDDLSSSVWVIGQGVAPVFILEVPLGNTPQYKVVK